jgi:Ribonuclease G/E
MAGGRAAAGPGSPAVRPTSGAKPWRYAVAMAVETATIRVTRQTRDLLARQARERGMSLSAMLNELARDAGRQAVFRTEREATRVDASRRDVAREERDWERTLGDGVG